MRHPHRTSPDVPSQQPLAHRRWRYILLLIGVALISFVAGIAAGSAGQAGSSTAAGSVPVVLAPALVPPHRSQRFPAPPQMAAGGTREHVRPIRLLIII